MTTTDVDNAGEKWRQVVGWHGYEVSDCGRVRSIDRILSRKDGTSLTCRGKILKLQWPGRTGLYAPLCRNGRPRPAAVGRLVLQAFIGPCPRDMECCHNDGNFRNNNLSNLRWDTHSNNMQDQVRHGTNAKARRTHCNYGHPYEGLNLYISRDGRRHCRACRAKSARREYARRAEKVA